MLRTSRTIRHMTSLFNPKSNQILLRRKHNEAANMFSARIPEQDFYTVCVRSEIEQQLIPVVSYLQNPMKYDQFNVAPKGVLLSGPPGTGKSALAEAIAGQAGVGFILISCASLIDKYVGETERKVRDLFKAAEKQAPCVICFDEFDSLASERSEEKHYGNDTVNQLLTSLSEQRPGVVVIATTNSENLDPAVIRPGRFDRTIYIGLPDLNEREKILAIHTRDKVLADDVSLTELATISPSFSGAKLAAWVKEACMESIMQGMPNISNEHFANTFILAIEGTAPQYEQNEQIRHASAVHEAGHALVAHVLGKTPLYVAVTKKNDSLGRTLLPINNNYFVDELLNYICISLGGIAAEELLAIDALGSDDDIEKAVELVNLLIRSKLDKVNMPVNDQIKDILNDQKERARIILLNNKEILSHLVTCLHTNHFLSQRHLLVALEGKMINPMNGTERKALQMPEKKTFFSQQTKPDSRKLPLHINSSANKNKGIQESKFDANASPKVDNTLSPLSIFSHQNATKDLHPALTPSRVADVLGIPIKYIHTINIDPSAKLIIELSSKTKHVPHKVTSYIKERLINQLKREGIRAEFIIYKSNITIHAKDVEKFIDHIESHRPEFGF